MPRIITNVFIVACLLFPLLLIPAIRDGRWMDAFFYVFLETACIVVYLKLKNKSSPYR